MRPRSAALTSRGTSLLSRTVPWGSMRKGSRGIRTSIYSSVLLYSTSRSFILHLSFTHIYIYINTTNTPFCFVFGRTGYVPGSSQIWKRCTHCTRGRRSLWGGISWTLSRAFWKRSVPPLTLLQHTSHITPSSSVHLRIHTRSPTPLSLTLPSPALRPPPPRSPLSVHTPPPRHRSSTHSQSSCRTTPNGSATSS